MKQKSVDTMSDEGKRQYHIDCVPGDLAQNILLVGDPQRVARVAKYFDSVRFENNHREIHIATGVFRGLEISVMSTGMGLDNTEIVVIETCQVVEKPNFIRCGSCGLLQDEPKIGDLIISTGALRLGNTSNFFVFEGYPAMAHPETLLSLQCSAENLSIPYHCGITASAPGFYGAQGRKVPGFPLRFPNLTSDLKEQGILNFEMETEHLFVLSQLQKLRVGSICYAVAQREKNEVLLPKEQREAEAKCIEVALNAFLIQAEMDQEKQKNRLKTWLPSQFLKRP